MFSFLVAQAVIGAVKALPRVLGQVNAALDIVIAQQKGEPRIVVDVSLGLSPNELSELLNDARFKEALARGEVMKRSGAKSVTV